MRGRRVLLVFLKAPVPGRVKTRLAKEIGSPAATRAYLAMCRAVKASTSRLRGIAVIWAYDCPPSREGRRVWRQSTGDLGARLSAAFRRAFGAGAAAVCAIGVDSPDLPASRIARAFARLSTGDVVLGPAEDGGYYLIGMRAHRPELFEVPWSSNRTLAATLSRARASRLRVSLLPRHHDVDDAGGLRRWLHTALRPSA